MKRAKRLQMTTPKLSTWAGEPNARELAIHRRLDEIERKYLTVGLTKAEEIEGVRLHLDLIEESQRRAGVTLIKITRDAEDTGASFDFSAFNRVSNDVEILMRAGMPQENALARAIEDERWRQRQKQTRSVRDGATN